MLARNMTRLSARKSRPSAGMSAGPARMHGATVTRNSGTRTSKAAARSRRLSSTPHGSANSLRRETVCRSRSSRWMSHPPELSCHPRMARPSVLVLLPSPSTPIRASRDQSSLPYTVLSPSTTSVDVFQGEPQLRGRWLVEVSSGGDRDDEDRGEEPVDGRAERGPPSCVGDVLAVLLPGIFEPVAGVAEHEQPGGSGHGG